MSKKTEYQFSCALAPALKSLAKQLSTCSSRIHGRYIKGLLRLDRFMAANFPGAEVITKEIAEAWQDYILKQNKSSFFTDQALTDLRKVSRFLNLGQALRPHYVLPYRRSQPEPLPFAQRLHSGLKPLILEFINAKRQAGYPYQLEGMFIRFDKLVSQNFPGTETLTRDIVDAWLDHISARGVSVNTVKTQTTPLRQFAKYLNRTGREAYLIPSHIPGRAVRYQPHLITQTELKAFFKAADCIEYKCKSSLRHLSAPVLFRLMYANGLRAGEAAKLEVSDVDLKTGRIFIRESKAHALRVVYMHADLLEVMQRYHDTVDRLIPGRRFFFVKNIDGGAIRGHGVGEWFRQIWDKLPEAAVSKPPRITARDFRHLYAVSVVVRWVRSGSNLLALAPYLSKVMGHSDYAQTSYYIHLAENLYPDIRDLIRGRLDDGTVVFTPFEDPNPDEVPYDN